MRWNNIHQLTPRSSDITYYPSYHGNDVSAVTVTNKWDSFTRGCDSSVGIATRYGLDGPGIESRLGRDFPHPSRPALGPTQSPVKWVPGLSRGWSGRGVVLIPHPHLQCRGLKLGRATPLPALRALVACIGGTFTFTHSLNHKLRALYTVRDSVRTSQRTQCPSIRKANGWILYREIVVALSKKSYVMDKLQNKVRAIWVH